MQEFSLPKIVFPHYCCHDDDSFLIQLHTKLDLGFLPHLNRQCWLDISYLMRSSISSSVKYTTSSSFLFSVTFLLVFLSFFLFISSSSFCLTLLIVSWSSSCLSFFSLKNLKKEPFFAFISFFCFTDCSSILSLSLLVFGSSFPTFVISLLPNSLSFSTGLVVAAIVEDGSNLSGSTVLFVSGIKVSRVLLLVCDSVLGTSFKVSCSKMSSFNSFRLSLLFSYDLSLKIESRNPS